MCEFIAWLVLLGFTSMNEDPGVHFMWHTLTDSQMARRGINIRKLINREEDKDSVLNLAMARPGS